MDAMSLSNSPSRLPPHADNPLIPDQMVLPVPKRTRASRDRRIFYGFAVSEEWLITYCEQNTHRIRNYATNNSSLTKIHLAQKLLSASSGIKNLRIELVFSKAPNKVGGHDHCVPFVSVCSSMKSSYLNRPNESQLDKLKSIIGGWEPDWYIDAHPASFYSED